MDNLDDLPKHPQWLLNCWYFIAGFIFGILFLAVGGCGFKYSFKLQSHDSMPAVAPSVEGMVNPEEGCSEEAVSTNQVVPL